MNDKTHAVYIQHLAKTHAPLIKAADTRHLSWPWGVSFSTWGVNWENSAGAWSTRKTDCARIALLNKGSGWCEKSVVGVGDFMTLADYWKLEAITVAVPLSVLDGTKVRYGPHFLTHAFSDDVIEKISDHAVGLVSFMKKQRGWKNLKRIYLSAGCEWRHYSFQNPSRAVLTYAKLVKRIREKVKEKKVIIVASASDSADIPGIKQQQASSWNQYLYRDLHTIEGIALDLHRYRGMVGVPRDNKGKFPITDFSIDKLIQTGVSQRGYLTVDPSQWRGRGKAMPTVLLENAIHGVDANHQKHTNKPRPWAAVLAHADLVREALAGESLAFLGWAWFPEDIPPEWTHGAIKNGKLAPHARAQAFLSSYHHGVVLNSGKPDIPPRAR